MKKFSLAEPFTSGEAKKEQTNIRSFFAFLQVLSVQIIRTLHNSPIIKVSFAYFSFQRKVGYISSRVREKEGRNSFMK